jgi:hypothetical protein
MYVEQVRADLDCIYGEIGNPATYNGADVTVCVWRANGLQDAGGFVRETASCRVRISEVTSIKKGSDALTYGGVTWLVDDVERSDAYEHLLLLVREYAGQL